MSGRRTRHGATLIALLVLVAIIGVAAAITAQSWSTRIRREKEQELLFRGLAYKHAIESYERITPAGASPFPARLDQLLYDDRFPTHVRHLRRSYVDPMTGSAFVPLLDGAGHVRGVASSDKRTTLKRAGFPDELAAFEIATRYSEWRFIADPVDETVR